MTQRTYKGMVAPDWAEYVVFGPGTGRLYWANDSLRESEGEYIGAIGDLHIREGWRREELDPLPTEVWGVFGAGSVVDARMLNTYASEAAAQNKATELARAYTGYTFIVARITQKITQPKPVQPELVVEKL